MKHISMFARRAAALLLAAVLLVGAIPAAFAEEEGTPEGEAVTAVIVKAPGAELDEATVRNWCKGKIAGFMKPRKVFFVNELPVNSTGKIDKRKLTEMFN